MWERYDNQNPVPAGLHRSAHELLVAAIPALERREDSVQRALLGHSAYAFYVYRAGEAADAMLAAWEFGAVRYIEHFAVSGQLRGGGLGSRLLQAYLARSSLPALLEAEPAGSSSEAGRRIQFYQRNGFHINNDFKYSQPPLRRNAPWIPLQLMSWPQPITRQQYEDVRVLLYREVYGLSSVSLANVLLREKDI